MDTHPRAVPESEPFLDHPETAASGRRILEAVQREGDRGAMLVAGEMLSAFLADALRAIRPGVMEAKELDRLFKGVGPLANWSTRTRVAALIGLISPRTLAALDDLREVRNKAAHSEQPFVLETHKVKIRRAFDLGPGTAGAVNRMALDAVMGDALQSVLQRGSALSEELGRNPFESPKEVVELIGSQPELMTALGERAWRLELGLGVWILLGIMRLERDAFMAKVVSGKFVTPTSPDT